MSKWIETRKKPVLPLYFAGAAWVIGAILLPIYSLAGFAGTALLSAAAYLVGSKLCPERIIRKETPYATGQQEVDTMLTEIAANLDKLHSLNSQIPDAVLSDAMTRMEKAGRSILSEVEKFPDKASQVNRFSRYYLPEVVKIMEAYAKMEKNGVKGENAAQILREVQQNANTMATAFENQLDALYSAEAMDISTDIEVLDNILKSQNLVK